MRSKAFFVNGGYGRVVSSIPAFELYAKESNDDDFIIVCEGGTDAFKGHPDLDHRAYDNWHKNLFQEKLKDRDIISPEPYRIWEYYNQKLDSHNSLQNIKRIVLFASSTVIYQDIIRLHLSCLR